MQVSCSFCSELLEVPAAELGQQISCPHCMLDFELTAASLVDEEDGDSVSTGSWLSSSLSMIVSTGVHTALLVCCALITWGWQVQEPVGDEVTLGELPVQQTLTSIPEENLEVDPAVVESADDDATELTLEPIPVPGSGGGSVDLGDTMEALATSGTSVSANASLEGLSGKGSGASGVAGTGAVDAFAFQAPQGGRAVTRGSFTAWTVPADPVPRMSYMIVIQIKLPRRVRHYRISDLSGLLIGTDTYRQVIPVGAMSTRNGVLAVVNPNQDLEIRSHQVQLMIRVPGAVNLVRDRIDIRSAVLNEKQVLEIVF